MTIITSKSNALIKQTKKLLQKKYRKTSYLIEGWHLVEEANQSGAVFRHVFVLPDLAERVADLDNLVCVSEEVLKELTTSKTPQGIVAELELPNPPSAIAKGRYLVLEDVQDPGNVGTMIRTADAAGLDGVILSEKSADIYNQKTLRAMQGSHFHLPIWRLPVLEACHSLQSQGVILVATTLSQSSSDYQSLGEIPYFALVMGNEGAGISSQMTDQADKLAHITMPGQAESLNVSVAAGILLFSLI